MNRTVSQGEVIRIPIEGEVKKSYLTYAMSVIVARALPDVRDGLKPVHRRILYAMHEIGLTHDKPFKKSAHVIGEVMANYHPHGDAAIYDTLVRLAQTFSLRYPVVQGQGNFGSIDGDPPAAFRYTEARLMRLTQDMVQDLDKDVVDFQANYDGTTKEPSCLPTKFPFLLANGTSGIAVGMATNLAPHNLREIASAMIAVIEDPQISVEQLLQKYIFGPDFPTGALIYGEKGIRDAFTKGKGQVVMRACYEVEEHKTRTSLVITEIPYAVNKASLVMQIAEHIRAKNLDGIADLRDESNRMGIRVVLDLKRDTNPQFVINYLFAHTDLQKNFNIYNLVLVDGLPKCLNLKDLLQQFITHRVTVIERRTQFNLKKALARIHLLEGFILILASLEEVIGVIRASYDKEEAKKQLIARFIVTDTQADAILELRLQRLTGLEVEKIQKELEELNREVQYYRLLLSDNAQILAVIKTETQELVKKFGDERRTRIIREELQSFVKEDLITEEPVVILYSYQGYLNRVPLSEYKAQARGGKGSNTVNLRDEDFIRNFFISSTHDYIIFFTNQGKAYFLKAYEIAEGKKSTRGKHIRTFLQLEAEEYVTQILCLREFSETQYAVMVTEKGQVIRFATHQLRNARRKGIRAVTLKKGDNLKSVVLTDGTVQIVLLTQKGYALRCNEKSIRSTGRNSQGVKGIKLRLEDQVVEVLVVVPQEQMILITEKGYGKRFEYDELKLHGRGTQGQICYKANTKTGVLIGAQSVSEEHDILCVTEGGKTVKVNTQSISLQRKAAMGVRVVSVTAGDKVIGLAKAQA